MTDLITDPLAHWEDVYKTRRRTSSGQPGSVLVRLTEGLAPGRALDLGASNGDDAIWLAGRGWQALGVDISPTACDRATARAASLGLGDRARFEARDLGTGLPHGPFDLVTALYFQSHVELPRARILAAAAAQVAPGGHLLVVSHAAPPPWASPEMRQRAASLPTVESELADIAAMPELWQRIEARVVTRTGRGPDGATAELQDNVVFLRRLDT